MEQKMEPAMVPMPNHYKPSFSCGIYGSFVAHQTLQKMIKKDQKMREIKMMEEQKMQDFNREMERKKRTNTWPSHIGCRFSNHSSSDKHHKQTKKRSISSHCCNV
eukprot:961382_1